MGRIVHLAMRVEDLDKATEFYTKVFGFTQVKVPGLRSTARYLTDGTVHIAINQSRGGKEEGPAIDHFGIEVDDVGKCINEVGKYGCKVVSEPGKVVKFRAPGGIIVEAVPAGSKPGIGDEK
jgi:lactoylglutathione lyase